MRYGEVILRRAKTNKFENQYNKEETHMNENEKVLTDETFTEAIAKGLTLVDFYADWCQPCRMLSPTIAAIAEDYAGKIQVGKLNIDNAQNIAAKYGVMSIPTVILFKDGVAVEKKVGLSPKNVYEKMIDSAL
jgi:thioredoxin 1